MSEPPFFAAGLDLGQQADSSAWCALAWPAPPRPTPADPKPASSPEAERPVYSCRSLYRWPLHTSYLSIAADVAQFIAAMHAPLLVVDASGVGRGVVEMLLRALQAHTERFTLQAVTITGGQAVNLADEGTTARVAKVQLVSTFNAVLQARRFRVPKDHPEAVALRREMHLYKLKVTASGAETFAATGRTHDDLVMAAMLAVWGGEQIVNGGAAGDEGTTFESAPHWLRG